MSCLRERHMQRSALTKLGTNFLWGVCSKGKDKPGFAWGLPRYSPAGSDIGLTIWTRWKKWSLAAGEALQYAITDDNGRKLAPGGAADAVRFLLSKHGIQNPLEASPEVSTVRGMRKEQQAAVGQRIEAGASSTAPTPP